MQVSATIDISGEIEAFDNILAENWISQIVNAIGRWKDYGEIFEKFEGKTPLKNVNIS